jgi:transposase InsO family protein
MVRDQPIVHTDSTDTRPADRTQNAPNVLQQQTRFDTFVARYNQERPHQALDMQVPPTSPRARRDSTAASRM